ncbi:MAG: glycogen synthase GlgA [Clostridia bacterium]|nr:glycogen synthase GlgA [Clostridia bacterium]NCC75751.1 glycogen synthase GlgA [Clostridia bacterium]
MKVLLVTSELAPLAKAGGLGDVAGALPQRLRKIGVDIRCVLPLYKQIKDKYTDKLDFLGWKMIRMGWRTLYCGVYRMDFNEVPIYFIDNEYYFGHNQLYIEYTFDVERFSFFQRAVLEVIGDPMDFEPDILHLNDWQSGMIPALMEAHYRPYGKFNQMKTVYTIHNLKYQGIHSYDLIAEMMELPDRIMSEYGVLKDGVPNFMKAGIVYADRVTTVSPTYAGEIMTEYFGEGLNWLLQSMAYKVSGILNGIDVDAYDPATDKYIAANYDRNTWGEGKTDCKVALQKEMGLTVDPDIPLAVMISRLVDQKGVDLLLHVLDEMLDDGIQVVILGTGDPDYEHRFWHMGAFRGGRLTVRLEFDQALSHRMYAGADLFLMPSLFEPCGLSQMISMRYGTIPLVRATGGLKDTVTPFNVETGEGNGFSFPNINAHDFLFLTKDAAKIYREKPQSWAQLVDNAMKGDYSWDKSAQQYKDLFETVLAQG